MTLGQWLALELADARDAWRDARKMLAKGQEPIPPSAIPPSDAFSDVLEDCGIKRATGLTTRSNAS